MADFRPDDVRPDPCPWCGSEYLTVYDAQPYGQTAHVHCQRCHVDGPSCFPMENASKRNAILLWNARESEDWEKVKHLAWGHD